MQPHRSFVRAALMCGVAVAAFVGLAPAVTADEFDGGVLALVVENDVFFDMDRNYTNGLRLSWTSAERQTNWMSRLGDWDAIRTEWSLGQSMFTPKDLTLAIPDPTDRPYAGWLYVEFGVVGESEKSLDQLSLSVGVVGPSARAGDVQKWFHDLIGSREPMGWDRQIDDQAAVQFTGQRTFKGFSVGDLGGVGFDLRPHVGASVGSVHVYANAGATLRIGPSLPDDYGPPRIQPSLPGSNFFTPVGEINGYLFAAIDGRAVGYSVFLDSDVDYGPGVEKKNFVADAQVGAVVVIDRVRLTATHVWRTEEYKSQKEHDEFGSVSVSVLF